MNKLVTVLTPTYNREKYLLKLFKSLSDQTNQGFEWLIVDDGSTDGTEYTVSKFKGNSTFKITYIKKENGGKHTALNIGFKKIDTLFIFIVDSDDILTKDAIQQIYDNAEIVKNNNLCGISFLRGYSEIKCIGDRFPQDKGILNGIDIQFRYKVRGDKAEVWRTDILNKYTFPVFEGEKFQGENYIWWQIAREYNMLYINKIIYITEYLEGGLSLSGKKMRIKNPCGGMENAKMAFFKEFPLLVRIKYSWLYICYGFFAGENIQDIVKKSEKASLIIPNLIFGWGLYKYWKTRYGD